MKDGEILEKINRLNNRMIKNEKTQQKDIEKLEKEILDLKTNINKEQKSYEDSKKAQTPLFGIGGAFLGASLIALIATFDFFVSNLIMFLGFSLLGLFFGLFGVVLNKKNSIKKEKINNMKSELCSLDKKLYQKQHILENLDQKRENWYKKLDKELNKSKKNVAKNLPVRNKTPKSTSVNNSSKGLTK